MVLGRLKWQVPFPVAVWVASRLILFIWAIAVAYFLPARHLTIVGDAPAPPATGLNLFIEPWMQWDTLWYLRIATRGYAAGDLTGGFFPFYPLAIRALTWVIPNALFNALLISNFAALGAFIIFYRVAQDLYGEPTARRALIYWVAFPTSFYFFTGYAEALFVFGVLLSIAAAWKSQWTFAGIAGALATLTRPPGFLILAPLGIAWIQSRGTWMERVRRALPLALIPFALGAFMVYLQQQFGDALFWLHAWNNVTVAPWDLAFGTAQKIIAGSALGNNLVDFALTFLILGLTLIGARRVPLSFTIYAFALIFVQMMAYPPALGFADMPMAGLARRVAVVFPAFLALAQVWRGKWREPLWVAVSMGLQLIFVGIFVSGWWLD